MKTTKREHLASLDKEELEELLSLTEESGFARLLDYFQVEQSEIANRLAREEIVDPEKSSRFSAGEFALYKIGIANGLSRFINKLSNLQQPLKAEMKRRDDEDKKKNVIRKKNDLQTIYSSI